MGFTSDKPSVICEVRIKVFSLARSETKDYFHAPPFRKFLRRPDAEGEEGQPCGQLGSGCGPSWAPPGWDTCPQLKDRAEASLPGWLAGNHGEHNEGHFGLVQGGLIQSPVLVGPRPPIPNFPH